MARRFLDWLRPSPRSNWLEVGCGTGALSQAVCRETQPRSLVACDPTPEFVSFAGKSIPDCPATFLVAAVDNLPSRDGGFDFIVSGLVLNFLPQPLPAVLSMKERLRPGGTMAAYVWDYAEGMQFLRAFWDEVVGMDPSATSLDEGQRFPLCHPTALAELLQQAGLNAVATTALQIPTIFSDFDDYWAPFLGGAGPAPAYVATLTDDVRAELRTRLRRRLSHLPDNSIQLTARALAVRGSLPS